MGKIYTQNARTKRGRAVEPDEDTIKTKQNVE